MIGQSGGRSAKNRQAPATPARATQRQRQHVDPPAGGERQAVYMPPEFVWTQRGRRVGELLLWTGWFIACCFIALLVAAAFNIV